MRMYKLKDMYGGWYIGNFPCSFVTNTVEVSFKKHPKGEVWDTHYHEKITEINLLVKGKMVIQETEINSGDIFILDPLEIADPVFLEDCEVVCVKIPGIRNDKVVVSL
jgi:hypothetical protein